MINLTNIKAFRDLNKLDESKEDDERLLQWFIKGIAEDSPDFAEDWGEQWFNLYKKLKQLNRLPADYKDQYQMMKKYNISKVIDTLKKLKDSDSSNQTKKKEKKGGAKKVFENDDWLVLDILNYDAAKHYGKGTKWCISGNFEGEENKGEYWFNNYLNNTYSHYYFVFNKKTGEKYCISTKQKEDKAPDIWAADDTVVYEIDGLPNIEGVYEAQNIHFVIEDGILKKVIFDPKNKKKIDDLILEKVAEKYGEIKEIGEGAFEGCQQLNTVTMPWKCTKIGKNAFRESSIEKIYFSEVSEVGENAFADCWNLVKAGMNSMLKTIPDYCFYSCPLQGIDLSSVEKIGKKAIALDFEKYRPLFFMINEHIKELDAEFIDWVDGKPPMFMINGRTTKIVGNIKEFLGSESLDGLMVNIQEPDFIVNNYDAVINMHNKRIMINEHEELKQKLGEDKYNNLIKTLKKNNQKVV